MNLSLVTHKESFLAYIFLLGVNKDLERAVKMACIYIHWDE